MRFFELLAHQHLFIYFFPALLFIIIFGLFLGYTHFFSDRSEERKKEIIHRFPEGFEDCNAPFPLGMTLTIIGTVVWAFFYILAIGVFKVAI
ncbi:MAG: hypothetical protein U5L07_17225 [Desulfobacterales bacterium]|nr:hypothetical protein [Desulfobacterales bacterium]